jgi:hypothetical protein
VVNTDCSIDGVYGSSPPNGGPTCLVGVTGADDAIIVPSCSSGSGSAVSEKLWIHYPMTGARDRVRQIDLSSGDITEFLPATTDLQATGPSSVAFNSAGCVTELASQSTLLQVGVFDITTPLSATSSTITSVLEAQCPSPPDAGNNKCALFSQLPVAQTGTGFVISGGESQLVATIDGAEGVQLSQAVLLSGGELIERSAQPTEAEPALVAAGNLDLSSEQDLVWAEDFKRGLAFQVSYPIPVNGDPLSATTPTIDNLKALAMELGSFDGTGNLQVATYVTGTGAGLVHGVIVAPTGVQPESITPATYTSCPP